MTSKATIRKGSGLFAFLLAWIVYTLLDQVGCGTTGFESLEVNK